VYVRQLPDALKPFADSRCAENLATSKLRRAIFILALFL